MVNHKETTWGPIIADRRRNRLKDDGRQFWKRHKI
jgi:hypothetical protein